MKTNFDLIIGGGIRSGASYIFSNLLRNPLFLSPISENLISLREFKLPSRELIDSSKFEYFPKNTGIFHNTFSDGNSFKNTFDFCFKNEIVDNHILIECSNSYLYDGENFTKKMGTYFPHLFLIFRHPTEKAESYFWNKDVLFFDKYDSFDDLIQSNKKFILQNKDNLKGTQFEFLTYGFFDKYILSLNNYPKEKLHIIKYDNLDSCPDEVFKTIYSKMGIEYYDVEYSDISGSNYPKMSNDTKIFLNSFYDLHLIHFYENCKKIGIHFHKWH